MIGMMNNQKLQKWILDSALSNSCLRRVRLTNYQPGHVRYQFGHYPCNQPYQPDAKDWLLLDRLAANGIEVIHLWWWQDMSGFYGKNVFEPINEHGLRKFISACHKRKLAVIPYVSPGYLDIRNPAYRQEWSRGASRLREDFYDLDMLCPGSPGWRRYFLENMAELLDNFGFDGLYLDGGMGLNNPGCSNIHHDSHIHYDETVSDPNISLSHENDAVENINPSFAALWNDFLCEVYTMTQKRRKIHVLHVGSDINPPFTDKCWDYLVLGEGVAKIESSLDKTKNFEPFVVRFNDWSRLITNWQEKDLTPNLSQVMKLEKKIMATAMTYLQFPWLEDGNYGEDEDIWSMPKVTWPDFWEHWFEWRKAQKSVSLPPLMGASFVAGRKNYLRYLKLYKKMTKDATVVYMEIKNTNSIFPDSREKRRVSVFLNEFLWVAIANLSEYHEKTMIKALSGGEGKEILLPAESLIVLKYGDMQSLPEVISFD